MFDVTKDYSNPANEPVRFIAEGRDPSATIDAGLIGTPRLQQRRRQRDHGHPCVQRLIGKNGVLGAKHPHLWKGDGPDRWRAFYTQQHGDNATWELLRSK